MRELVSIFSLIRRGGKRQKDPKYEFVSLFGRIERDASQSAALLAKAIPLPDDAETQGAAKKQRFK